MRHRKRPLQLSPLNKYLLLCVMGTAPLILCFGFQPRWTPSYLTWATVEPAKCQNPFTATVQRHSRLFTGTKNERSWDEKYNQLVEYRKKHGDCNVPRKDGSLGIWVSNQRARCRSYPQGNKFNKKMTTDRIARLEKIDFDWEVQAKVRENKTCSSCACICRRLVVADCATFYSIFQLLKQWDEKYALLVKYQRKNGHCNVPTTLSSLGTWVNDQRNSYRRHQQGDDANSMTPNRIARLEAIGFQWDIKVDWETRYQELVEYKKKHGHCNVNTLSLIHI